MRVRVRPVVAARALVTAGTVALFHPALPSAAADAPTQPIAFGHMQHTGEYRIA